MRAPAWPLVVLASAALGLPAPREGAGAPPPEASPEVTRPELEAWVRRLSSDALEGRETGEPGGVAAGDAVAGEFARLGLLPKGDAGGWFQAFTVPRGTKVLPTTALAALEPGKPAVALALGEDFASMDVSGAGTVEAPAVFAGYGVSAPDLGYDDWAGLDAKGKVAVVLRHAPAYREGKSPFGTREALERHASFPAKAAAAVAAGAAALVVVNDPATFSSGKDELRPPGGSANGKIPVVHVTWKAGRRLAAALDLPLAKRQQQIDGKVSPASEPLEGTLRVRVDLAQDVRAARNVVGLLEPARPATTPGGAAAGAAGPTAAVEAVLLGAHYDHVGRGRFGSLAGGPAGKIHNGADDNASGTAALLEVAGWLASRREDLRRRVVFVAFDAEELGLLGSKHYVGAPAVPLPETVAMVNLDMVGRAKDGRVFVGGVGTSPVFPALVEAANAGPRLSLKLWPGGKAPSDHQTFYEHGLPVLFLFTGLHEDYHRPSDDWEGLEYPAHEKVARLAGEAVLALATCPDRPVFTRCDAGGFEVGPYLGAFPEPAPEGVRVARVEKRSPAAKAGVREGDVLTSWNGAALPDVNAFNDAISKAKKGEKVELGVRRGDRTLTLRVTLGST